MSLLSQLAIAVRTPPPKPAPKPTYGDAYCKRCGERERLQEIQGSVHSTISKQLGICFECLNYEISLLAPIPPFNP